MELKCVEREGVLVIKLEGETLDASRSQVFKAQVFDIIEQYQIRQLIFDMASLRFIDSSGLGAFLAILRQLHADGGDLKLAAMSHSVKAMFQIVRMHKLFAIFETVEDSIQSYALN